MFKGGYRNCVIVETEENFNERKTLKSREKLVGEISTDGVNWETFEKTLWRNIETDEPLFKSWWNLAGNDKTATDCYFESLDY